MLGQSRPKSGRTFAPFVLRLGFDILVKWLDNAMICNSIRIPVVLHEAVPEVSKGEAYINQKKHVPPCAYRNGVWHVRTLRTSRNPFFWTLCRWANFMNRWKPSPRKSKASNMSEGYKSYSLDHRATAICCRCHRDTGRASSGWRTLSFFDSTSQRLY